MATVCAIVLAVFTSLNIYVESAKYVAKVSQICSKEIGFGHLTYCPRCKVPMHYGVIEIKSVSKADEYKFKKFSVDAVMNLKLELSLREFYWDAYAKEKKKTEEDQSKQCCLGCRRVILIERKTGLVIVYYVARQKNFRISKMGHFFMDPKTFTGDPMSYMNAVSDRLYDPTKESFYGGIDRSSETNSSDVINVHTFNRMTHAEVGSIHHTLDRRYGYRIRTSETIEIAANDKERLRGEEEFALDPKLILLVLKGSPSKFGYKDNIHRKFSYNYQCTLHRIISREPRKVELQPAAFFV